MKTKWFVIGTLALVIAVTGAFAISNVAFAQGPVAPGWGMTGRGWMGAGGYAGFGGPQNSLISIAAKALNLQVSDLIAELQKGKSVADVAKEKNVSTDKIVTDFIAAHTTLLKSAVDAGRLTQAQADSMLALMKTNVNLHVTTQWTAGSYGMGMMGAYPNGVCPFCGTTQPSGWTRMMGPRGWR